MYDVTVQRIIRQCESNLSSKRGWSFGAVVSGDICLVSGINSNGEHVVFAANLENPDYVVLQHDGSVDLSPVADEIDYGTDAGDQSIIDEIDAHEAIDGAAY